MIGNLDNNYRIIPSGRGFRIAALNVNHLLAHINEIRILLAENPLDILAINETKPIKTFPTAMTRCMCQVTKLFGAIGLAMAKAVSVASTKSLGVHVHEHLSWNTHITKIIQKSCFGYRVLSLT